MVDSRTVAMEEETTTTTKATREMLATVDHRKAITAMAVIRTADMEVETTTTIAHLHHETFPIHGELSGSPNRTGISSSTHRTVNEHSNILVAVREVNAHSNNKPVQHTMAAMAEANTAAPQDPVAMNLNDNMANNSKVEATPWVLKAAANNNSNMKRRRSPDMVGWALLWV